MPFKIFSQLTFKEVGSDFLQLYTRATSIKDNCSRLLGNPSWPRRLSALLFAVAATGEILMNSYGFFRATVCSGFLLLLWACAADLYGYNKPNQANPSNLGIFGAVVRVDGSSPPFGVEIEFNCGDGFKKATETSLSGTFYFEIDPNCGVSEFSWNAEKNFGKSTEFPDDENFGLGSPASGSRPSALMQKKHCELRAHLPGYQSRTIDLLLDATVHVVDVGTIVLRSRSKTRGFTASFTSLKAPKAGKKAMEQAQEAIKRKDLDAAEKSLQKATAVYPEFAEAWFLLGWLYQQEQRNRDSQASYEQAVAIDDLFVRPYIGLADLARREKRWAEMLRRSRQALELDSISFPEAYYFNALANYNLNNLEAAERIARKEQSQHRDNRIPRIHLLLANILYKKNDLAGSVEELRIYLKLAPGAPDAEMLRKLIRNNE
jgi:tetratricopeptide (TPR) repeat protein